MIHIPRPLQLDRIILTLIMILAAVLAISCVKEGHDWGGDFSLYIAQAQAILNGTVEVLYEENKFMVLHSSRFAGPYLYPFGFPVLLSGIYYIVGLDFVALKLFCTVFFIASLPLIYGLAKKDTPKAFLALVPVAGIAFHPVFLQFSDGVQADFPYLFFSLLALWLMDRANGLKDQVVLGIVIFLSFWIRDVGVLLLPALFTLQVQRYGQHWNKISPHRWWLLSSPYLVFAVLFIANSLILPYGGENHMDKIMNGFSSGSMFHNFDYYLSKGLHYLYLNRTWPALLMIGFLTVTGMIAVARTQLYLAVYFMLVSLVLVTWPFLQNFRYLMPIIPLYLYFLVRGVAFVSKAVQREKWIYAGLILITLVHSYIGVKRTISYWDHNSNHAVAPGMIEIYRYVQDNVTDQDIIGFHKPRVLRLFTGKRTVNTDLDHFATSKANYLLQKRTVRTRLHYPVVFEWEHYILLKKQ